MRFRPNIPPPKKQLTIQEMVAGANAMLKVFTGDVVSEEEIARRASICEGCPMRESVAGCATCGMSRKVANSFNEIKMKLGLAKPIPRAFQTFYCGVCGCSLALLGMTKQQNLKEESEDKIAQRPSNCWMRPENFKDHLS